MVWYEMQEAAASTAGGRIVDSKVGFRGDMCNRVRVVDIEIEIVVSSCTFRLEFVELDKHVGKQDLMICNSVSSGYLYSRYCTYLK